MSNNPFFVGGPVPPEYFMGRTSEIKIAFDLISKRSHGAFYGCSGIGKSSLLRLLTCPEFWRQQIPPHDPSKAFIVYLNCTDINPFIPTAFLREILNLLKDEAEEDKPLQSDIHEVLQKEIIKKDDMRQILRRIGKQGKFLMLLIDDYDAALRYHDTYTEAEMLTFLSEFRNLAVHSKEGQHLCTLVTSFRRLNELGPKLPPGGSPWYNHYLFQLIFDNIWKFSTDEEQVLLMLVALSRLEGRLGNKKYALNNIDHIFSQRAIELIDLEQRGIIQKMVAEEKSTYGFTSSRWSYGCFEPLKTAMQRN